jgi:hypothetical protein
MTDPARRRAFAFSFGSNGRRQAARRRWRRTRHCPRRRPFRRWLEPQRPAVTFTKPGETAEPASTRALTLGFL